LFSLQTIAHPPDPNDGIVLGGKACLQVERRSKPANAWFPTTVLQLRSSAPQAVSLAFIEVNDPIQSFGHYTSGRRFG
jgi:hypothetical protein